MHLRRGLALVSCLAFSGGCDDGAQTAAERTSATPVLRLVELPARTGGEPRSDGATLARWQGADLADWRSLAEPEGVRFSSPAFEGGLDGVGRVELELVPGGARRLELLPTVEGDDAAMRRVRRVEVPLEQNLSPDTAVSIHVELLDAIHGNWADTDREGSGAPAR